jgi:hypothetical protein
MNSGCPAHCATGTQKPIGVSEFSQLSNGTRADIVLLEETAWICENCGSVYVTSENQTILLDRLPLT